MTCAGKSGDVAENEFVEIGVDMLGAGLIRAQSPPSLSERRPGESEGNTTCPAILPTEARIVPIIGQARIG
jgi:hypothetical protein